MPNTSRAVPGIAPNDHEFHTAAKMIRQSPHFMPGSTGHLLFSISRCARACPFPVSGFFRLSKIEFPWGCSASRIPCELHGEDLAMARALNFGCGPHAQILE